MCVCLGGGGGYGALKIEAQSMKTRFIVFNIMETLVHLMSCVNKNTCNGIRCLSELEIRSLFWANTYTVGFMLVRWSDLIMGAVVYQIISLTIFHSTVYTGASQSKHQNSVSLAFVLRIHLWLMNSPHKWLVTRKMFPFDDVIITISLTQLSFHFRVLYLTIKDALQSTMILHINGSVWRKQYVFTWDMAFMNIGLFECILA